jgi:hypothetical protein
MNTFKQILLGLLIIASMYCGILMLIIGKYLAGGILLIVCIFCVFHAKKVLQRIITQQVTDNVSRETFKEKQ